MKTVITAALILVLILFLIPLLAFGGTAEFPAASPVATLPPDPGPASGPSASPAAVKSDAQCTLRVAMEGDKVVEMTMKDYLWGVVAAEMPASFEPEALKAQAVAARTFAYSRMGKTIANHPDADVCTDSACCQAYIDREAAAANWADNAQANTDKIEQAVTDTDGLVILYGGKPIEAVFHSSSAGRTLDAVEVWGSTVPYLTGVESPEGEEVPNYHSTAVFTPAEFKEKFLAQYPKADLSGKPAKWFGSVVNASNGGVHTMEVGGVAVSGAELRALFSLRSTDFTVTAGDDAITFSVTGYGHGVGMSQYGANALAREGKSFTDILQWYYTGVTITRYPS